MKINQFQMTWRIVLLFYLALPMLLCAQQKAPVNIKYIDNFFENASPLNWEIQGDTIIKILLTPDHERESINRQTTHWHFRLEADKGEKVRLIIAKAFPDIYNGRLATKWWDYDHCVSCYISFDQIHWTAIESSKLPGHELLVEFTMENNEAYVARIPPYLERDLEKLKDKIKGNPLVEIIPIGHTIEKRPLEIIRLGNPEAKHSILLRARAHPWEPGGNWVVEGLIEKFLEGSPESEKWKDEFCYYIMPMANKDGVFHGKTRFNMAGIDLNRKWLGDSDPIIDPEDYALKQFVKKLISQGHKPIFAIDFHNDNYGNIHITKPKDEDKEYIKKMELFREILLEQTWFSEQLHKKEQLTGSGNSYDGLYHIFGIDACVLELNADYIRSLDKMPEVSDWKEFGAKLNSVFSIYLDQSIK